MKKITIIAISTTVICVVGTVALIAILLITAPQTNQFNIDSVNTEIEVDEKNNPTGSSASNTNIADKNVNMSTNTVDEESLSNRNTNKNEDGSESKNNTTDNITSGNRIGTNASVYSSPGLSAWQERFLNTININKTSDIAEEFMKVFLNFNSNNLGDGTWRRALTPYVDTTMMKDMSDDDLKQNMLWQRYSDPQWATNCSSYPAYKNKLLSIEDVKVTAAYTRDGKQKVPVVMITTIEESNEYHIPSMSSDWKPIDRVKKQYQVQFTPSGTHIFNVILTNTEVQEYDIYNMDPIIDESLNAQ